jgi:hypothetical protein
MRLFGFRCILWFSFAIAVKVGLHQLLDIELGLPAFAVLIGLLFLFLAVATQAADLDLQNLAATKP